jgi:hypothetical protein
MKRSSGRSMSMPAVPGYALAFFMTDWGRQGATTEVVTTDFGERFGLELLVKKILSTTVTKDTTEKTELQKQKAKYKHPATR